MSDPAQHPVVRALRSFTQGLLLVGERYHPRRFVLDPSTGRPVMPMPEGWSPTPAGESGAVLYLPDDTDPVLQLTIEPRAIDPRTHEAADRWSAYHGSARERSWAALEVESARYGGEVVDRDSFDAANPLRSVESRLLKELNADRERLARLCRRLVSVEPALPLAVGIDPDGIDVRASLGVVRVEFPSTLGSEEAVRRAIAAP